jgi:hypothetical protein
MDGWLAPHSGRFTHSNCTVPHFIGGYLGPRVGLYWLGKTRLQKFSILGPSSPLQVATPTAVHGPPSRKTLKNKRPFRKLLCFLELDG